MGEWPQVTRLVRLELLLVPMPVDLQFHVFRYFRVWCFFFLCLKLILGVLKRSITLENSIVIKKLQLVDGAPLWAGKESLKVVKKSVAKTSVVSWHMEARNGGPFTEVRAREVAEGR